MSISLQFNTGATVTLRETSAKDGSIFLAARPASETKVSRFGFNVPLSIVGGKLPTSAKVMDGKTELGTITMSQGVTETGNIKVVGDNAVDLVVNGVSQKLKVERISQPNASTANVLIRSARPSSRSFTEL